MSNTVEFYPEILKNVGEIERLAGIYDSEVSLLDACAQNIVDNAYVESIDEYGATRLENILGLHKGEKDSLDGRRFRILSKLNRKLPYTFTGLKNQLDVLCGTEGYDLKIDYVNCVMIIDFIDQDFENVRTVKSLVDEMIPMNLLFKVNDKHSMDCEVAVWNKATMAFSFRVMPRRSTELLLLNGKWLLDGECLLTGYREENIDLYPTCVGMSGNALKGEVYARVGVYVSKEVDLWFLGGEEGLDGTRSLSADIVREEL